MRSQTLIASIINSPQNDVRVIIKIRHNPLTDLSKVLLGKVLDQIIETNICDLSKNSTINFTPRRIPLQLIKSTTPIGEVFMDYLGNNFRIILDTLFLKNSPDTVEELCCDCRFLLSWNCEINAGTSRVERFDDLVLEVCCKDESAVAIERLNIARRRSCTSLVVLSASSMMMTLCLPVA